VNDRIEKLIMNFKIDEFQKSLIDWYLEEKRDLPWRKNNDPYRVWVSEVMLQQTRVDTVIPYFERFMEKYPTVADLAEADEQDLLKVWEGLGYYSRVRNLHHAVKEVHEKYGGKVPDTKEAFGSLKGVGPYTTGAVLSIAYGKPIPAVDGNVMRVMSRIFNMDDDIAKVKTRKLFEGLVEKVISHEDPSSFNQGLMELGALICTPKNPSCLLCPVRDFCMAFHEGTQNDLPVKKKVKKGKTVQYISFILEDEKGNIIVRQRPSEGLLASLWEFPNHEVLSKWKNMVTDFESMLGKELGIELDVIEPICVIDHVFSHLTWKIHAFRARFRGDFVESEVQKVIPIEKVENYPFPVPYQKIWKAFKKLRGME
jgi:A/G-specific adenine glycosylase